MSDPVSPCEITLDDWRALCPSLRVARLADGACVYRQGECCRAVYIIARGHIKLSRVSAQGEQHTLVILPAGELCGAHLFERQTQGAADTATTKGPTQLYGIPRAQFLAAVAADARVAGFAVDRLARRQAVFAERIAQLLDAGVARRVAAVLAELIGAYGGRCAHGHEVDVRLTQQELAEMTGVSRPTVSTLLNRLRIRGVVSYTRRYICIDDLGTLTALAHGDDDGF